MDRWSQVSIKINMQWSFYNIIGYQLWPGQLIDKGLCIVEEWETVVYLAISVALPVHPLSSPSSVITPYASNFSSPGWESKMSRNWLSFNVDWYVGGWLDSPIPWRPFERSTEDPITTTRHIALSRLKQLGSYVRLCVEFSSAFNTIIPHKWC